MVSKNNLSKFYKYILSLIFLAFVFIKPSFTYAQTQADWYMAGGNPQRTSWVSEEVRGGLGVEWYQPIEPYIPYKIQPVFFNGVAYISTSKGLYAFDVNSTVSAGGTRVKWIYPTELPLGHSPTIATVTVNGTNKTVAYVGGFDRKVHAIDVSNGQSLSGYTPFEADAGFETNPLIIKDSSTSNISTIIAGSRDGKLYALNAITGAKIWQFQTNGPILYSAAYKNGVAYFASNDLYAYAVNVNNGTQKWKSQKFQYSKGFFSYWPVVYTEKITGKEYVVFTGATNYRSREDRQLHVLDMEYFIPGCVGLAGTCPSGFMWTSSIANNDPNFLNGTTVMDLGGTSSIPGVTTYYETLPNRRMVFVVNAADGTEFTYNSNGNSNPEYAPFTWAGATSTGTKYPAVINGIDNIMYQNTLYYSGGWIARGDPVGWKFGTQFVSLVSGRHHAYDEPLAYSGGGKILYWSLCCDREAGAFDVTLPLTAENRAWDYYGYNLITKAPDYHLMYNDGDPSRYNDMDGWHIYSGKNQSKNGVYGKHGSAQSPPVPYQGKVYMLKGNTLFAWKPSAIGPAKLSLALITPFEKPSTSPTVTTLKLRLETEIKTIIQAGHLRPGYHASSPINNASGNFSDWRTLGESLDYFSNPSDTVYSLLLAYPHLSETVQTQVKTYLQNYYGPGNAYDVTRIQHIGWGTGASREAAVIPPEVASKFIYQNPTDFKPCCAGGYWQFNPFNFYAAWKYALIVGNGDQTLARNIFNSMSAKIEAPTSDEFLLQKPYFTNLYAAGYLGYLELKKLAGLGGDTTVQGYYDKVLALRMNFSKDTPYWPDSVWCGTSNNCAVYQRGWSLARNFAFLTPEIATRMKQELQSQVQNAVNEYQYVAPYWFVGKFDATVGEGTLQHLYDSPSLFQAKAWILGQPYEELVKYLDVPSFEKGDLFYIQNLVAAIQAPSVSPSPITKPGDTDNDNDVDMDDYIKLVSDFGTSGSPADFNKNGTVDIYDYNILIGNYGK